MNKSLFAQQVEALKQDNSFVASDLNTYNSYFELYNERWNVLNHKKNEEDVYKEHLSTASKNKLIDIAVEGHNKYVWANDLAYKRGLEIEELKTEMKNASNEVAIYSKTAYNSKIACLIAIITCILVIGLFYLYQFIKFKIRKYADKVRSATIEELKKDKES